VGATLAGSLEMLGERLLSGLRGTSEALDDSAKREEARRRLRDVLNSDRNLAKQAGTEKRALESAPPVPAESLNRAADHAISSSTARAARDEPQDEANTWKEPIRTRSMARLLASQGHHNRALAIYEELLRSNAVDAVLREEADALRARVSG
jgi:hypothetical protein